MSDDLHRLVAAVREARAEISRWRALKTRSDWESSYEDWERAGRELVHWTYVEELRVRELANAVLDQEECIARNIYVNGDSRLYSLTDAGRAALAQQRAANEHA